MPNGEMVNNSSKQTPSASQEKNGMAAIGPR